MTGVRAERLAAGLRRRDPRHRGGRCRAARCWSAWDWPGWPALGGLARGARRDRAASSPRSARRSSAGGSRPRCSSGVAGYAMAGLFVLSGAPDLALTQVAVETLSTVVFVLVLRRLPERFERQSSSAAPGRAARHRRPRSASRCSCFALVAAGVPADPAGVRRDGGAVGARRPRPQRRQRHPRRLPRLRHPRRDHRARRRVASAPSRSPGSAAGRAERRGERTAGRPAPSRAPARVRRRLGAGHLPRRADDVAVAAVRRPQPTRAAGSSAGSSPARRSRCATSPAASTRCAGASRFRPWTVLGAGLLLAAATAAVPLLVGGGVLDVGFAVARPAAARRGQRQLGARLRHRRLPRGRRHGAHGVRGVRRRARRRRRRDGHARRRRGRAVRRSAPTWCCSASSAASSSASGC